MDNPHGCVEDEAWRAGAYIMPGRLLESAGSYRTVAVQFTVTEVIVPNVLMIHHDVALQLWLACRLAKEGSSVVPAKTPAEALMRVAESEMPVDLLIVDPTLEGVGEFIETLRRSQGRLRVLSVTATGVVLPGPEWLTITRSSLSMAATASR